MAVTDFRDVAELADKLAQSILASAKPGMLSINNSREAHLLLYATKVLATGGVGFPPAIRRLAENVAEEVRRDKSPSRRGQSLPGDRLRIAVAPCDIGNRGHR
jgi:hypothetical protein